MTEIILVLFLICLTIQVCFHQVIFRSLVHIKNDKPVEAPRSVSVVIAARNEAKHLPNLISTLMDQKHEQMEVIIINDRSKDNTSEVVKDLIAEDDRFRLLEVKALPKGWTGKKYALKLGITSAQNDILLFTDADCVPKSVYWVDEMTRQLKGDKEINLGFSPYKADDTWLNRFIQFETLISGMQYLGLARMGQPYMGVGRNLAIAKPAYDLEFLDAISHITGGDDDLMINHIATKTNTTISIAPSSQTLSIPEVSWPEYFNQKTRHLSVGTHYDKKHKTLLGVFTLSFVLGWIFFLSLLVSAINPYLILAAFGLRSLSFYSIFARIGQKFDAPIKVWALPILDLCYSIYYPVVGLRALSTKSIKWK